MFNPEIEHPLEFNMSVFHFLSLLLWKQKAIHDIYVENALKNKVYRWQLKLEGEKLEPDEEQRKSCEWWKDLLKGDIKKVDGWAKECQRRIFHRMYPVQLGNIDLIYLEVSDVLEGGHGSVTEPSKSGYHV